MLAADRRRRIVIRRARRTMRRVDPIHASQMLAADRRRRIVIRRARRTMRRVDHNPRKPGAGRRPPSPDCDPAGTQDYAPRGSQSTRAGYWPPTAVAGL